MSEITNEEKRAVISCCNLISQAPERTPEIVQTFIKPGASFDYLFYLERLRSGYAGTQNFFLKTIKQVKIEVSRRESPQPGSIMEYLPEIMVAREADPDDEPVDPEELDPL